MYHKTKQNQILKIITFLIYIYAILFRFFADIVILFFYNRVSVFKGSVIRLNQKTLIKIY